MTEKNNNAEFEDIEILSTDMDDEEEILMRDEPDDGHDAIIVGQDMLENEEIASADTTDEEKDAEVFFVNDIEEKLAEQQANKPENKKGGFVSELIESVETFCYALVMMVILFVFVFRFVTVQGESMTHTLESGDKLIISDMLYSPSTGDIVVVDTENMGTFTGHKYIIKRVIATGGQKVDINFKTWQVWVDGTLLSEKYVRRDDLAVEMRGLNEELFCREYGMTVTEQADGSAVYSFTVPEDTVFVMGDNRMNSTDGRSAGCMEEFRLMGRVLLRLSPDFGGVE